MGVPSTLTILLPQVHSAYLTIFRYLLLLATLVNPYYSGSFITVRQMCGNLISWTVILTDRLHTFYFSSLYVRISPLAANQIRMYRFPFGTTRFVRNWYLHLTIPSTTIHGFEKLLILRMQQLLSLPLTAHLYLPRIKYTQSSPSD